MLRWKLAGVAAVVAVAVLGSVSVVMAQAQGPRGGRQGRGQFDPAQMNQWMMQRMKEQLGATDDEWAVIEPRLEKVQTLARDARGGGMGGMFGRGQFGGPGGVRGQPGGAAPQPPQGAQPTAPQSAVSKAAEDLRTTLGDQNSTVAQVKAGSETWIDWDIGAVAATTQGACDPPTAIRLVQTSVGGTSELQVRAN